MYEVLTYQAVGAVSPIVNRYNEMNATNTKEALWGLGIGFGGAIVLATLVAITSRRKKKGGEREVLPSDLENASKKS